MRRFLSAVDQFSRIPPGNVLRSSILTEETGGNLALPASGEAMVIEAQEIAKDINSQYVMSYKPV